MGGYFSDIYKVMGSVFNTNLASKHLKKKSRGGKFHSVFMAEHEALLNLLMTLGLQSWTFGNKCCSFLISEVFQWKGLRNADVMCQGIWTKTQWNLVIT